MDSPAPRSRGRPKDAGKRAAVLDAARALFLRHGADGVALDVVIAEAGVSKATFYANFADRGALVEAVIRRESDRVVPAEASEASGGLAADLTAFGVRLLSLLSHPDMLGFERLIAGAARAHPDLPGRFFEAGPGRSRRALAERIAAGVRSGELQLDELADGDPRRAAEDLVGLWQGMMRVEMTMGGASAPDEPALHARSARGVRLFLRLYGVGPTRARA